MALSNYSDLQFEVTKEIMRSDAPFDRLLVLAEGDVAPYIRHHFSEKRVFLTSVDNVVTLPSDFTEARSVLIDGVLACRVSAFDAKSIVSGVGYFQSGATYAIVPPSDIPRTVELVYYSRVPALTAIAPTNWLLTKFPAVLFHATLVRAYRWLKDPDAEEREKASLSDAMALLAKDHLRAVNSGNTFDIGGSAW